VPAIFRSFTSFTSFVSFTSSIAPCFS
jgi:hypothetical protein